MTDLKLPKKSEWPRWAVECFVHEGQILFKNKHGQVKHSNGHFAKGFSGNKSGISSDHAKQILKVRSMCLEALLNKGLPRLIKELQKKDLSAKDLVAIVRFLSETSIPKQFENTTPQHSNIPQIIISKEAIDRAEELDRQYANEDSLKP